MRPHLKMTLPEIDGSVLSEDKNRDIGLGSS